MALHITTDQSIMASADIQNLLRFLTGPAKIPLRDALAKAKPLLADGLSSPESIAKASLDKLRKTFPDEKLAKQVLSAAKRTTNASSSPSKKKRSAADASSSNPNNPSASTTSPSKRRRPNTSAPVIDTANPQTWESGLDLPPPNRDTDLISATIITINRAPLLLAFAVVSLEYTHPWLPRSSRFSLAQGLLDATAASKAKYIGITRENDSGNDALEEGYKRIRVLGKEIPVLRRWDVELIDPETSTHADDDVGSHESAGMNPAGTASDNSASAAIAPAIASAAPATAPSGSSTSGTAATLSATATVTAASEPIYWALSPKLLAQPPVASKLNPSALPIHLPHAAHSYLTRSFPDATLPLLLGALHIVYASWADSLDPAELDRRGWGWYARVRPAVDDGPEGWGGRGAVKLKDVLGLRKAGS
ncbi:hypothetical protein Dda_7809 [Drechslerella dactyloides]|uniref:Uncharacterized protein n=1 Tax=Drechslerella dactyloides TaxID=74499 RepID=A0AAD6IR83_DREDA|nr:hypothetical protein Dda_7809 [Drechslerella dactyloides]